MSITNIHEATALNSADIRPVRYSIEVGGSVYTLGEAGGYCVTMIVIFILNSDFPEEKLD